MFWPPGHLSFGQYSVVGVLQLGIQAMWRRANTNFVAHIRCCHAETIKNGNKNKDIGLMQRDVRRDQQYDTAWIDEDKTLTLVQPAINVISQGAEIVTTVCNYTQVCWSFIDPLLT